MRLNGWQRRTIYTSIGALLLAQTATAGPRPTATEIFNLRTECSKLSKEFFKEKVPQASLSGFEARYDPRKNRCYIAITQVDQEHKTTNTTMWDIHSNVVLSYCSRDFNGAVLSSPERCKFIQESMKDNADTD
jgi:hypothetical protein